MKKILVTGTAGFIGFHLAKRLLERGDTVVGIDNINDYYDVNLKYARLEQTGISRDLVEGEKQPEDHSLIQSKTYKKYTFSRIDLKDKAALDQLVAAGNFDAVVNLAAQAGVRYSLINPQAYIDANIVGFTNILEACRHNKINHLVYASSSSVYGLNAKMPFATSHCVDHPVSLYAASKKSNELMAHCYSHLFNVPTTGLRFFTVYGPWGRPDMALFLFTKAILEGEPIDVFNHGNMRRDFTYIDDIVEGVVRVIDNPPQGNPTWDATAPDPSTSQAPYRVYNIGNNSPVRLMDFINAIEQSIGKTAEKHLMPIQPGDVEATWADVTDLINDLGYRPDTPITTGVQHFVEWYRGYYRK